ncbi:hypothetical protein Tco_1134734 [Tanacetum coccineum]
MSIVSKKTYSIAGTPVHLAVKISYRLAPDKECWTGFHEMTMAAFLSQQYIARRYKGTLYSDSAEDIEVQWSCFLVWPAGLTYHHPEFVLCPHRCALTCSDVGLELGLMCRMNVQWR